MKPAPRIPKRATAENGVPAGETETSYRTERGFWLPPISAPARIAAAGAARLLGLLVGGRLLLLDLAGDRGRG